MSFKDITYLAILLFMSSACQSVLAKGNPCPCPKREHCHRTVKDNIHDKEIYILTNGSSAYEEWNWDTLTTVIAEEGYTDTAVMCYAHSKEKKYGFMVDIPTWNLSISSKQTTDWIDKIDSRRTTSSADVVIVNLMPIILSVNSDYKTEDVVQVLAKIKKSPQRMVDCVVPWKPHTKVEDKESLTSALSSTCDHFIVSPESYMHIPGYSCKARATVPVTKLVIGIDEYLSEGILENRVILGIPWHGYDYTCKTYVNESDICNLDTSTNAVTNVTTCNIMNRDKLSMGNVLLDPRIHKSDAHHWSMKYQAPFHTYYDSPTGVYHQRWYEDIESLRIKYTLAKDLELKGIAIWTGDDLSYAKLEYVQSFDSDIFSWVLHDLLNKGQVKPRSLSAYYMANTVTAVALGCLFGGMLLGIVFTCIGFKRLQKKKKQRPPFQKDTADEFHVEDYHDEDLNL